LSIKELLKFIIKMKWQALPLLVSICLGLQRSGRKISDVSELTKNGVRCESNGQVFCHGNVVRQYGSTYGNVCKNGKIKLMRMPSGYAGPKPCQEGQGQIHCSGAQIEGSQTAFVEEWCVEGEIFFINKITGLTFQKGRLSGANKTTQTISTTTKNNYKARSTTTTTTTSTTTSTTTTTAPTTTTTTTTTTTSVTTSASSEELRPVAVMEEDTPTSPLVSKENEFSLEYVNSLLEDKIPNLKVLQCWSRFNLCFIQIGESDPLRNVLEIRAETP